MAEMINLDAVTEGLKTIASLRNGVSDLFKCLTEGVGGPLIDPYSGQPKTSDADPSEEAEKQFLADVQGIVEGITHKIVILEKSCDLLSHPSAQVSVHLSLLGQDPALERNGVYKSVVSCYRWCDRMHDYVTQASHILNQNICRRSTIALDPLQRILIPGGIGRRSSFATINTPSSQIDAFFNNLSRIHPNVTLEISRPFGAPTVFITIDRILKGCLLYIVS
uniref:60S ribosomal protein L14 n=1 Tax=Tetranychus truncatus TaxID=93132 RepID=A0A3G5AP34_9ACAR|nr:60S ribosomal protein L14 [Tetranychus truncatus]